MAGLNDTAPTLNHGDEIKIIGSQLTDGNAVEGRKVVLTVEGTVTDRPPNEDIEYINAAVALDFFKKSSIEKPVGNFPKVFDRWDGAKYRLEFQIVGRLKQDWNSVNDLEKAADEAFGSALFFLSNVDFEVEGQAVAGDINDPDDKQIITYQGGIDYDEISVIDETIDALGDAISDGIGGVTRTAGNAVGSAGSGLIKGFFEGGGVWVIGLWVIGLLLFLAILYFLHRTGMLSSITEAGVSGAVPG